MQSTDLSTKKEAFDSLYKYAFQKKYERAKATGHPHLQDPLLPEIKNVYTFINGVIKRLSDALNLPEEQDHYLIKYLNIRSIEYKYKPDDFRIFKFAPTYEREENGTYICEEHLKALLEKAQKPTGCDETVSLNNFHNKNKIRFMILCEPSAACSAFLQNSLLMHVHASTGIRKHFDTTISQAFALKMLFNEPIQANKIDGRKVERKIESIKHIVKKILQNNQHCIFKWLDQIISSACLAIPQEKYVDGFVCALLDEIRMSLHYLDALPADYNRHTLLYSFINDLIFVFMAYLRPYSHEDFVGAMNIKNKKLFGMTCLQGLSVESFAATSGMDAFCMAYFSSCASKETMELAREDFLQVTPAPISKDIEGNGVYFEIEGIFGLTPKFSTHKKLPSLQSTRPIFITGIKSVLSQVDLRADPIVPTDEEISAIAKSIHESAEQIDPESFVTVIIDNTIELSQADFVPRLLERLSGNIKAGKINIVLCKSFQKYANLGTSKCKTGCVITINNKDPKFSLCHNYLSAISAQNMDVYDELQFMTCLLAACPDGEMEFIHLATVNALRLKSHFEDMIASKHSRINLIPYGPFLSAPMITDGVLGMPKADTFGFPFSTHTRIGKGERIAVGLEGTTLEDLGSLLRE